MHETSVWPELYCSVGATASKQNLQLQAQHTARQGHLTGGSVWVLRCEAPVCKLQNTVLL